MGNCPTCSAEHVTKSLDPLCQGRRMWTAFLFSSFSILLGGWMLMRICDVIQRLFDRWNSTRHSSGRKKMTRSRRKGRDLYDVDDTVDQASELLNDIKEWDSSLISGKTKLGKTFVTITFLCSIASLVLYCLDTKYNTYMESCTRFEQSFSMQVDFGLNMIFLVYFLLRFAVAPHKRRFWFSLYSLVDIFTIPPSFLAFYLDRTWLGFRFLRVLPIMNIPNILQYMGVIERPRTIRILQLASKFIAVWFAAAGAVHLLENSGDFFCDFCNGQEIDLPNTVYFMIITMTTVGYGDFSCKTYIGKYFVLLSLIGGLTLFATMIPEFANLLDAKGPYHGRYHRVRGKRHVIICGHIETHSLASFLHDFLHKGREEVDELDVLIIDKKKPDIEMEALLKRYYTKIQYFVGSIMSITDLQRVQVDKATACLIIANKECSDPNGDDSANIMRVISLKNFNHHIRILLQLLQYHNKLNVASIPGWNADKDEIVCIAEVKLGLIGMSCIVPGFATMMTNIFRMSSYNNQMAQNTSSSCVCGDDDSNDATQAWPWRKLYHRGAGMTMYLEEMSPSFYGKSFAASVLICFKLHVMLLAVEMERTDATGNTKIIVDVVPCDDCVILPGSRAFIVCMSSDDANRVKFYCSTCYPVLDQVTKSQMKRMGKCSHMKQASGLHSDAVSFVSNAQENDHAIVPITDTDVIEPLISPQPEQTYSPCYDRTNTLMEEDVSNFDSTGMFYYTPPRKIEDALLDADALRERNGTLYQPCTTQEETSASKHPLHFHDHIIVCLHADQSSPTIGLRNFVMPLRASSFRRHELPTIIFITNLQYIKNEWEMLSTFPDIYILDGSPINPYNLKLVSIYECRQCVIVSMLDSGNLDTYLVDKSSVLCALSIRQLEMKSAGFLSDPTLARKSKVSFIRQNRIQTLTTLTIDSNVQYVEQGHTDEVKLDFFLTTPFASGTAFADSVLDCILSCAYYNNHTVNLLRIVLMGGIDQQLEETLAEGEVFEQCETPEVLGKRKRARVAMLPIHELIPDINERTVPVTFSSLFCESLQRHRMVVLGIYRLLHVLLKHDPNFKGKATVGDNKRIVIYYPPYSYQMDPSDRVYVMQHSHIQHG